MFLTFAYFTVAVLSNPTLYMFLKRADGGYALNIILKVVLWDAGMKDYTIIFIPNSVTFRSPSSL